MQNTCSNIISWSHVAIAYLQYPYSARSTATLGAVSRSGSPDEEVYNGCTLTYDPAIKRFSLRFLCAQQYKLSKSVFILPLGSVESFATMSFMYELTSLISRLSPACASFIAWPLTHTKTPRNKLACTRARERTWERGYELTICSFEIDLQISAWAPCTVRCTTYTPQLVTVSLRVLCRMAYVQTDYHDWAALRCPYVL